MGAGRDGLGGGRRVRVIGFAGAVCAAAGHDCVRAGETGGDGSVCTSLTGERRIRGERGGRTWHSGGESEQLEPCGHHFAGGEPRRDTGVFAGEKDEKNAD